MSNDDRSPVVRLESRGDHRGPASMVDAVRRGLVHRRRRRAVAGLAAIAVAVVGIGVLLTDSPQPDTVVVPAISAPSSAPPVADLVEVPDVVGLAVDNAETLLQAAGLVPVRVLQGTHDVTIDEVFDQNPRPGRRLRPGDEVQIFVSFGAASIVPAVIALPQDDAIAVLAEAGYEWVIEFQADIAETGLVIAMDPAPGTVLPAGETVTLVVSAEAEQVIVPDLEGSTLLDAIELLESAGLQVEGVTIDDRPDQIAEGLVIRTEPPAGNLVATGVAIRIVVAKELTSVAVPNVVGLFFDTAMQTLRTAGLEPVAEFRTVPFGDPLVGLVLDQIPANFVQIPIGSEVVITVGEAGPEPPP
jgi:eukaryotic-like serine/threonine-protein kinase